ncbi:MAG: hypothetical protein Q9179_005340 [Wetmoreana sp. 5 TL-2023]
MPPNEDDQTAGANGEEGMQGEKERLEERLLETYRSRNFVAGDKMELFSAVQSSLRRKVAALEDDNWMFEAEGAKPG